MKVERGDSRSSTHGFSKVLTKSLQGEERGRATESDDARFVTLDMDRKKLRLKREDGSQC